MNYFKKRLERKAMEKEEAKAAQGRPTAALQGIASTTASTGMGTPQGFNAEGAQGFAAKADDMGGSFANQKKSFSSTQQGDNPNRQIMREDYGWKMNNAQYEKLQEDTKAWQSSVNQYKAKATSSINQYKAKSQAQIAAEQARYNSTKAELDKSAASTQAKLAAAKKELGGLPTTDKIFNDWYNKEKIMVGVMNPTGAIEGKYYVPRAMVNELAKKVEGGWAPKKNAYFVSTTQQGRVRGQEMHDMLRVELSKKNVEKEFWGNKDVQGGYAKTVNNWKTANSKLQDAERQFNENQAASRSNLSQFQTNIARSKQNLDFGVKQAYLQRDTEIGKVTSARQGQIDAAKKAYADRAKLRQTAYANLAKMSTTTNQGANNE